MFPKSIADNLGVAVEGTVVKGYESYFLPKPFITKGGGCQVGSFVRMGDDEAHCTKATGTNAIIGVIIRDTYYSNIATGTALPDGIDVTVALKGCVAVKNTSGTTATFGQKIFVKEDDGTLVFSNNETEAGATATGWVVEQGAVDNGIVFAMAK